LLSLLLLHNYDFIKYYCYFNIIATVIFLLLGILVLFFKIILTLYFIIILLLVYCSYLLLLPMLYYLGTLPLFLYDYYYSKKTWMYTLELDRYIGNTCHRGRWWDNRNHRKMMTIGDQSVPMFHDDVTH